MKTIASIVATTPKPCPRLPILLPLLSLQLCLSLARIPQSQSRKHPLPRVNPLRHRPMKRRERPIRHPLNQPMPHRIEMDIIQMRGIIPLIPDRMLPKPPLPDPRSRLEARLAERYSPAGILRENLIFIAFQRPEKSISPSGKVHRQCIWSGSTAQASIWNGARRCAWRTASRSTSMCCTSKRLRRSYRLTVKKTVPPAMRLRR